MVEQKKSSGVNIDISKFVGVLVETDDDPNIDEINKEIEIFLKLPDQQVAKKPLNEIINFSSLKEYHSLLLSFKNLCDNSSDQFPDKNSCYAFLVDLHNFYVNLLNNINEKITSRVEVEQSERKLCPGEEFSLEEGTPSFFY